MRRQVKNHLNAPMNINPVRAMANGHRFLLAAVAVGISVASAPSLAQPRPSGAATGQGEATSLSLKEAAQLAVLGNPEVLSRWHTIKAAQGEREVARGVLLPRVDLSAAKGRERGDLGSSSRTANSLSLTQLLYDGFASRHEIERLDHVTRVRLFEFFDTSEAVALEAVRAYVDVLRYGELVRLAEDNYVEHRVVFSQTDQRVRAKVAPSVDLEQVSGRVALAESNLLTEYANLHDTTARFQRVVGRLPGPQGVLPAYLNQEIPGDAGAALMRLRDRHGAVLAAVENVRAANAALASRKGAYGPRVDFRLRKEHSAGLSMAAANPNATAAEFVLTWNLFNGFGDRARERQFAEQVNVAMDLRDKACRDTRQTLVIAYNDVKKLGEQLDYLLLHESSTARALTAYRLQFSIGQRTLLSLLDTENELFQARRAVANARYDLHFAYARTQAGLGNLLRALELTSLNTDMDMDQLSVVGTDTPSECPPEPVGAYVIDRDALLQRAAELSRRAAPGAAALPLLGPGLGPQAAVTPTGAVPAKADIQSLKEALEHWRSAWTQHNLDQYFNSYAPTFSPARGRSREAWQASRRNIISSAKNVSITLDDVAAQLQDENHASTDFRQIYRSASYSDTVMRTMRWERVGNRWLIVEESTSASP